MPFTIIRQDITTMQVDAIVNAANKALQMGGGVCGAIFQAAGASALQAACDQVAPVKTGDAVITPGFGLPAKYVIHAVGPVYSPWNRTQSAALLRSAYIQSLKLAEAYHCASVAFPLISSGIFGYPKAEALQIATAAITDFLAAHEMEVYLVIFDKSAFVVSDQLLGDVESYINDHYADVCTNAYYADAYTNDYDADAYTNDLRRSWVEDRVEDLEACPLADFEQIPFPTPMAKTLEAWITELDAPFSDALFHLIDSKGKTDVEVYKKANIDRKLFSKIRSVKGYTPKKPTILALAVALELTLDETNDLLKRAGYALSHASIFDVIVEYFIVNGRYDVNSINLVLFQYEQPLLGA